MLHQKRRVWISARIRNSASVWVNARVRVSTGVGLERGLRLTRWLEARVHARDRTRARARARARASATARGVSSGGTYYGSSRVIHQVDILRDTVRG
eukprot:1378458-Amorphochlora_amoeboformis.AAC.1